MTAETKTTAKTPRLAINLSDVETIAKFKQLAGKKTNPDFLKELLDCYEKFTGKTCSDKPENFFPNLQGKEKQEKEPVLKEMFGLDERDALKISECDLLEKASEYSGKSIEEMSLEGRVLVAKNEIGRQVQYQLGKGKKGMGDDRIEKTLKLLIASGQKLSANRLTQASGSNRKTVDAWCERNELNFDKKETLEAWCERNGVKLDY